MQYHTFLLTMLPAFRVENYTGGPLKRLVRGSDFETDFER
jgi:hypothetical protein